MFKHIDCVSIWSEAPFKLSKFYEEKLGFVRTETRTHPQDTGVVFKFESGALFWIGKHSEVFGKSKEPHRQMIDFAVDSVESVHAKLSTKGVRFIAKPFKAPVGEGYFATFEDPEGNILQIYSEKK